RSAVPVHLGHRPAAGPAAPCITARLKPRPADIGIGDMTMLKELGPGLRMMVVLTILTGFIYPAVVTVLSQVMFRDRANGSLIVSNGKVIGSRALGTG